MLNSARHNRDSGFSLIELMIAVAIFGILASIAVPSYTTWFQNSRIRNAADAIQTGLQKARVEAIKHNADVEFELGANSAWVVRCVNVTADCPDPIESRAAGDGSSVNITVTPTPAGADTVVFTSLGRVRSVAEGAATTPFDQLDIDNSALSAADSRELRVVLGVGGSVLMCDPYSGLSSTDPRKCP
ncbi:MAG: GspH/FimT family pseudopilin [Methylotenera sp.]|nr:GspH/FimT family pseudopilin [Methylotenera sp.]